MAGRGQILAMVGEAGHGKVTPGARIYSPPITARLACARRSFGFLRQSDALFSVDRNTAPILSESAIDDTGDSIQEKVVDACFRIGLSAQRHHRAHFVPAGRVPDDEQLALEDRQSWLSQFPGYRFKHAKRFSALEPQQRRRHTLDAVKRVSYPREPKAASCWWYSKIFIGSIAKRRHFSIASWRVCRWRASLLFVNYRPGYTHDWADKSYYAQLRVEPLRSLSAEELFNHF